jgi:pimeloyl-ACP methyl ester carboxylesterase
MQTMTSLTITPLTLILAGYLAACSSAGNQSPDHADFDANDAAADSGDQPGDVSDQPADDGGSPDDQGPSDGADQAADQDWPEDPGQTGPCSYTQFDSVVTSTLDQHSIPVTVFVPQDRPGPYPLVVINHGFQIEASYYTTSAQHLASWCYLSVLCDFPATTIPPTSHETIAQDISDVVNWLKTESHTDIQGKVDDSKAALIGHSLGGKTSLLASLNDPNLVGAVIGLDPVDTLAPSLLPYLVADLTIPTLLLGETFSGENGLVGQYCAPLDYNYHQFFLFAPTDLPVLEVTFHFAQHMSWLDDSACGVACLACVQNDEADHAEVRRLSLRYMTAWLERFLRLRSGVADYLWGPQMEADAATGAVSFQYK